MKSFLLAGILLSFPALAARDSLMLIVRPEKALVQINEPGRASRLQAFLAALAENSHVLLTSADQSLKLDCGRNETAASCVIRFLPGANARIEGKTVQGISPLAELGIAPGRSVADQSYEFRSSNGDRFAIRVRSGSLELDGSKH